MVTYEGFVWRDGSQISQHPSVFNSYSCLLFGDDIEGLEVASTDDVIY